jgi:hypothetical protein
MKTVLAGLLALVFCWVGGAQAATPANGTLSLANPQLRFTSGPSLVSDPVVASCPESDTCDRFDLRVELPDNFAATNPSATIRIVLSAAIPAEDYDLFLLDENGGRLNSSGNAPPSTELIVTPASAGTTLYRVEVLPFLVAGGEATVVIDLVVPEETGEADGVVATGIPPRFFYFQSPNGVANGAGEPTLGFNPKTGRVMFIALLEPTRITFAENTPAVDAAGMPLPESCEAQWETKPYVGNVNTLDPILEVEPTTGRTLQSQLSGANSIFSISDDDGDTWRPAQIGPPNGGVDHQTVGVGPYSPNFTGLRNPDGFAVYYCSQSIAAAFCARSDDGGLTFGPGVPMFNPQLDCNGSIGALHGHVQVAPDDGTVYVPFGNCGGQQAMAVSEDSGLTWTVKTVPETSPGDDPGVGVGSDGTVYFCYVNDADGQPRMAVSQDKGDTFFNHNNLAAGIPIATAVFPTAVAGDGDRAACAWLGTDDPSPGATASASDFPGFWYPYISVTYDRGASYHTVNVSPNDPVQGAGGICLAGTTCGSNRNLLDFNDIQKDDRGRILFGHADGCIGACVSNPSRNTFSDNGVIAVQSGGRTLFSAFDNAPDSRFNGVAQLPPARACLRTDQSVRDARQATLVWNAPDDGGTPISGYTVLRATSAQGSYEPVGQSDRPMFVDTTTDPAIETYFYKVVAENTAGASLPGNVIALPVSEVVEVDTCTLPGDLFIVDALGDGGAPDTDIEFIAAAELASAPDHFAITYKVADFTAGTPPATAFYPVLFQNPLGDGVDRYFAIDAAVPAAPRYVFGTFINAAAGVLVFEEEGTLEGSLSPDGTMVVLVPRSFFGNPGVGEAITGFDARARVGAQSATSRDTAGPSAYIVRGTARCTAAGAAVAALSASTNEGPAPLDVIFTVGGTSADGAQLSEYTLNFGDGQSTRGGFGGQPSVQVAHRYTEAGNYRATAAVTDSAGNVSENTAAAVVEATAAAAVPGAGIGGNDRTLRRGSGAFGLLSLAILALFAWRRRVAV